MSRIKTGGMQRGFHYSKKRFWITDGISEKLIFEDELIPDTFYRGRLKGHTAWNKGLTKEINSSINKMAQNKSKYNDEDLLNIFIKSGTFTDYYKNHSMANCRKHFNISENIFRRIIELGAFEDPKQHYENMKPLIFDDEYRHNHSIALKGKNTWSKGRKLSEEHIRKVKESHAKRTPEDRVLSKEKEWRTRVKNGTNKHHKTKDEIKAQEILQKYFNVDDIYYNYFDRKRYPFKCDFYIKSVDLFIEVNAYPSHGGRPYLNTDEDQLKISLWESKLSGGKKQYQNWIYTWTDLDVRKLNCAKENNLNFIVIYDVNDLEGKLNGYK